MTDDEKEPDPEQGECETAIQANSGTHLLNLQNSGREAGDDKEQEKKKSPNNSCTQTLIHHHRTPSNTMTNFDRDGNMAISDFSPLRQPEVTDKQD